MHRTGPRSRGVVALASLIAIAACGAPDDSQEALESAAAIEGPDLLDLSDDSLAVLSLYPDSRSRSWRQAAVDSQLNILIAAIDPRQTPPGSIDSLANYRDQWRWDNGGVEKLGRATASLLGLHLQRLELLGVKTVRDSRVLIRSKLTSAGRMVADD